MTRWQVYLVLGIGIFGLGLGTGLGLASKHYDTKATTAQTQADEHHGAAQAAAAQAAQVHAQADALAQTLQNRAAASARAAEATRNAAAKLPPIEALPALPNPTQGADLVGLVQAQAQELTAVKAELQDTKLQLSLKSAEADRWHQAYEEDEKALALQKIAMDATIRRERISGWTKAGAALVAGYFAGKGHL